MARVRGMGPLPSPSWPALWATLSGFWERGFSYVGNLTETLSGRALGRLGGSGGLVPEGVGAGDGPGPPRRPRLPPSGPRPLALLRRLRRGQCHPVGDVVFR